MIYLRWFVDLTIICQRTLWNTSHKETSARKLVGKGKQCAPRTFCRSTDANNHFDLFNLILAKHPFLSQCCSQKKGPEQRGRNEWESLIKMTVWCAWILFVFFVILRSIFFFFPHCVSASVLPPRHLTKGELRGAAESTRNWEIGDKKRGKIGNTGEERRGKNRCVRCAAVRST